MHSCSAKTGLLERPSVHLLLRIAQWAALAAPAALVLALILRYGVNLPYWDQWALLDALVALREGTVRWDYLFAQHNEHRMPFTKAIMLATALATGWNVRADLIVSFLVSLGTLGVIWALMKPTLDRLGALTGFCAALAMSALLFSLEQWENWLWGWQVQWFLTVLALVSAVACATWSLTAERPLPLVAASAVAATIGQFTLASGVLIWVLVLLILFLHRERRWIVPAWIACAAVSCLLYFAGYHRPPHHPSPLLALEMPELTVTYIAMYLSGPLGREATTAASIGGWISFAFVLFALIAAIRFRDDLGKVAHWVALGAFAIGNAALTAVGRVGFGIEQALMNRYVTIALLLPVATLMLGLLALGPRLGTRRWHFGLSVWFLGAAALMWSTALGDRLGLEGFRKLHASFVAGHDCLVDFVNATDDCLQTIYPNPDELREQARLLAASGWSGFPSSMPKRVDSVIGTDGQRWHLRLASTAAGWIDTAVVSEGVLTVAGWARRLTGNAANAGHVVILAENAIVGEAAIDQDRPDVAAYFRDPTMSRSGWMMTQAGSAVTAGTKLRAYLALPGRELTPIGKEIVVGVPKG